MHARSPTAQSRPHNESCVGSPPQAIGSIVVGLEPSPTSSQFESRSKKNGNSMDVLGWCAVKHPDGESRVCRIGSISEVSPSRIRILVTSVVGGTGIWAAPRHAGKRVPDRSQPGGQRFQTDPTVSQPQLVQCRWVSPASWKGHLRTFCLGCPKRLPMFRVNEGRRASFPFFFKDGVSDVDQVDVPHQCGYYASC